MNVLAKRANGIFILTPILVAVYILLNLVLHRLPEEQQYVSMVAILSPGSYLHNNPVAMLYFGYISMVAGSIVKFSLRLFTCKTIIEYDDFGIYVYRKFRPTEIIRYEQMWNLLSLGELDYKDEPSLLDSGFASEGVHSARGILGTGTLRIRTNKKTIRLYGVKNVLQVETALNRLVEENRREFINELQSAIEQNKCE